MTGPSRHPSRGRSSRASSPRGEEDDLALAERPLEFSAQARYYAPFREQADAEQKPDAEQQAAPEPAPEPSSASRTGRGRNVAQTRGARATGVAGAARASTAAATGRKAGSVPAASPRTAVGATAGTPAATSVTSAAAAAATPAARASGSSRNPNPERPHERLSPGARALANRLAGKVSLVNTVRGFPHVLNRLARDWQEPLRFYDTMNDLLMDQRGNRAGFPFAVANELTLLLEHYRTLVHPPRVDERWKGIDPR